VSLWFISEKAPCYSYPLYDGTNAKTTPICYNQQLVTPPRLYTEAFSNYGAVKWFYDPGKDRLVLFSWFIITYWPGWAFRRLEFDAQTGAFLSETGTSFWGGTYTNRVGVGSYQSFYATRNNTTKLYEVSGDTIQPLVGGWSFLPPTILSACVVNLEDRLLAGSNGWFVFVWDISTGSALSRGSFRLPNTMDGLCYENRDNLWLITGTGQVLKMHYRVNPPRWSMFSCAQRDAEAAGYRIAFDTRRNRLAILVLKNDATDGACRWEIEFYRPLVKVAANGLTEPVPVTAPGAGKEVKFVAHLFGEQGEGLGAYNIHAALSVPAQGSLLTPVAATHLNGSAAFLYKAPLTGGDQDTLELSAEIEQDGS